MLSPEVKEAAIGLDENHYAGAVPEKASEKISVKP